MQSTGVSHQRLYSYRRIISHSQQGCLTQSLEKYKMFEHLCFVARLSSTVCKVLFHVGEFNRTSLNSLCASTAQLVLLVDVLWRRLGWTCLGYEAALPSKCAFWMENRRGLDSVLKGTILDVISVGKCMQSREVCIKHL
jgi:hypothetical protein